MGESVAYRYALVRGERNPLVAHELDDEEITRILVDVGLSSDVVVKILRSLKDELDRKARRA